MAGHSHSHVPDTQVRGAAALLCRVCFFYNRGIARVHGKLRSSAVCGLPLACTVLCKLLVVCVMAWGGLMTDNNGGIQLIMLLTDTSAGAALSLTGSNYYYGTGIFHSAVHSKHLLSVVCGSQKWLIHMGRYGHTQMNVG